MPREQGRDVEAMRESRPVLVSVNDVSMAYNGAYAVRSASFDLERGRFLTILGPSGSGKTTLLRLIAGFGRATSGEIFINGQPVSAVPPHKRSIGMVFQRLALFPHLTAAENVAFPLKMRRHDATTIAGKVTRFLELVKLGGLGGRRIHELSGGQQQRVAIARALVFEPDLLLLDEPLAALDRKLREDMQLEFRRIQRELGVTTINVTHDQREALVMSDEVIVMDAGKIQQKARPAETYRNPRNAFVANFIGVTGFVEGTATSVSGGLVRMSHGNVELAGIMAGDAAPPRIGQSLVGAIRAEQVRIAADRRQLGGLDTIVTGEIAEAIFEGERIVYEVRVAALGGVILRVFDHDPAEHSQFEPGAHVSLGWNASDVRLYGMD